MGRFLSFAQFNLQFLNLNNTLPKSCQQKPSLCWSYAEPQAWFEREWGFLHLPLYSSTNWFKTCNYLFLGVAVNWIKVVSYSWVNYLHLPTWWARLDKRAEGMDLDSCLPHGKKWNFPTEGADVLVVSVCAMFHLLLLFQKCNYLCYRELNGQSSAKKPTYLPRPPECAVLHSTVAHSVKHTQ